MVQAAPIVALANARGPTSGFTDVSDDEVQLAPGYDRRGSTLFKPLKVGVFTLRHRIVHSAMGRSRGSNGQEGKLAPKYFSQRATEGGLIISQATGSRAEWSPWPFTARLDNDAQIEALSRVIEVVHGKGGIWFQQLNHVGRCTSPALVKYAWEKAGHDLPPPYGYKSVAPSEVEESGYNTHSGEGYGKPHPLSLEQIREIQQTYKETAKNAIKAGADGIEILAGNGFLLDQFLHDNINRRTDQYGGSVENRSRFTLEVVDTIAEVIGYQKIGVKITPFSNFHETDGSQPLLQLLHLSRELASRGIAYLSVGEARVSRNLGIEENLQRLINKGIAPEDISLRPFRKLLREVQPTNPSFNPTVLFGFGGYTSATAVLTVDGDLADGVCFARRFTANPDLVRRIRDGLPLTQYDRSTFYTHGPQGYITFKNYGEEEQSPKTITDGSKKHAVPKKVAIIGAGVSGIVSANAFKRFGGEFDLQIFERKPVPGGTWAFDPVSTTVPVFPADDPAVIDEPLPRPIGKLPVNLPRNTRQRFTSTPLYKNLYANTPFNVMSGGSVFANSMPSGQSEPYLTGAQMTECVAETAHRFDDLIKYNTTLEDVEKLSDGKLRLLLRTENSDLSDTWYEETFDFLIVATGHNSVPRVPTIPGLETWKGTLRHSATWRSGEEFKNRKILLVGTSESAVDVCIQSLPYASWPVYVSQRRPHSRWPDIFKRKGVEVVSTISHIDGDVIYLNDGRVLTSIDTIVFATGYFFTFPFLSKIRPSVPGGQRIPGLYQHIFDQFNPNVSFIGVVTASVSWLTWEKSAFLTALVWSGRITLPPLEEQRKWEARRLAETAPRDNMFHYLSQPAERVIFYDTLNELAGEYLETEDADDELLRSFPWDWILALSLEKTQKEKFYDVEAFRVN